MPITNESVSTAASDYGEYPGSTVTRLPMVRACYSTAILMISISLLVGLSQGVNPAWQQREDVGNGGISDTRDQRVGGVVLEDIHTAAAIE